jgi:hypothetical protein
VNLAYQKSLSLKKQAIAMSNYNDTQNAFGYISHIMCNIATYNAVIKNKPHALCFRFISLFR